MARVFTLPKRFVAAAVLAILLSASCTPAHATSKEMIELQTQVQQLLDMVQRLQSTMDTRMGVMQHMLEQTSNDTTQMATSVNQLQQKLNAVTDATGTKLDTVSGQVQSLNDSVDELKSRIAKLDKSLQDMQTQLQSMQAPPTPAAPAGDQPGGQPSDSNAAQGGGAPTNAPAVPPTNVAPPLKDTFQAAYRDYMAAHYPVAASEFQDVIHYYPMDDLAGTAQFYLGEIAYRQLDYPGAIKSYNAVLEGFPGNSKAPAAQLRKGLALLQLGKRDSGIHELRLLIQRHPQTPEAQQARTKLNGLGVRIVPSNR